MTHPESRGYGASSGAGARPTSPLWRRHDAFIVDLDGVVYVGKNPVPHAVEVLNQLSADGCAVYFATNNASHTAAEIAERLTGFGLNLSADAVLTSSDACAEHIARSVPRTSTIRVVGADGIRERLLSMGYRLFLGDEEGAVACDVVVQGHSPATTWLDLAAGFRSINAGATWIATNLDLTIPLEGGLAPGNGAMVAALSAAAQRQPDVVIGKPYPAIFESFRLRCPAPNPLIIGDRRDTDIAWAHAVGCSSLQVDTGVDRIDEPPGRAELAPTYVAADLRGLLEPPLPGPAVHTLA